MKVSHQGGLTSCLTVIFHEASKYHATHGQWPATLDASGSFVTCKDNRQQDLSAILLAPARPYTGPFIHFDHDHQFSWYHTLPLAELNTLSTRYCYPSVHVGNKGYNLRQSLGDRTAVIYRGNDKAKEIAPTPYEAMFEMAAEAGGPYVVQTDELEFYRAFKARFPASVGMPGMQMIPKNANRSVTGGSAFAVDFIAALFAISQMPRIVCTTGNTSLWPFIWRGNASGTWQYFSRFDTFAHTP